MFPRYLLTSRLYLLPVSVLLIVIGCLGIIGLITNVDQLMTFLPGFQHINMSAAFCLILLGCGLGAISVGNKRLGVTCAALITAYSLLNLFEDLNGVSFGIDRCLDHFFRYRPLFSGVPGRMSMNNSFCFLSASGILFVLALIRHQTTFLSILAGVILGGILQAILGYASGIHTLFLFGSTTMSLPLGIGFICFSAITLLEASQDRKHWNPSLPLVVMTIILMGTVGIVALTGNQFNYEISFLLKEKPVLRNVIEKLIMDVGYAAQIEHNYNSSPEEDSAIDLNQSYLDIRSDLKKLAILTSKNPKQLTKVNELFDLLKIKSDDLANISVGKSTAQMIDFPKTIQKLTAEILNEEDLLINTYIDQSEAKSQSLHKLLAMTVFATMLIMVMSLVLVQIEVQARRRSDEALTLQNKELIEANIKAQESTRMKSQFLANMSHEIRTPMNGILGMTRLILDTPLSTEQRQLATTANRSAEVLLTILNDILDFSKIESAQLSFESTPFSLLDPINNSLQLLKPEAKSKGLELTSQVDAAIPTDLVGDSGRLHQILLNLIGNAIKFTEKGRVNLSVALIERDQESTRLLFEISDTGMGISQKLQNNLFRPFVQGDGSSIRKHGGTGLGLAISKELVERMGGEIGLKSIEGTGSTFWFTAHFYLKNAESQEYDRPKDGDNIPTEFSPNQQSEKSAQPGVAAEKTPTIRVLVAEDNTVNQMVVRLMLQKSGYEPVIVGNGLLAVEAVKKGDFDLVFMDCQMPELDGYEATQRIRAWESERKAQGESFFPVRIIAMTANAMTGDRETCLASGMDDYLSKPLKKNDLAEAITNLQRDKLSSEPV